MQDQPPARSATLTRRAAHTCHSEPAVLWRAKNLRSCSFLLLGHLQIAETLRGVYSEQTAEILRYAQVDNEWAQHESEFTR